MHIRLGIGEKKTGAGITTCSARRGQWESTAIEKEKKERKEVSERKKFKA